MLFSNTILFYCLHIIHYSYPKWSRLKAVTGRNGKGLLLTPTIITNKLSSCQSLLAGQGNRRQIEKFCDLVYIGLR